MRYEEFLTSLFEDGRVAVCEVEPLKETCLTAGDKVLAKYEQINRLENPEPIPDFNPAAARWAATILFRSCQLVVYRNLGEEQFDKLLGTPGPEPRSPDVHYSVDLVLRYLPSVIKLGKLAAEQDPLLERLVQWTHDWPLSSVGMPNTTEGDLTGIVDHPGLLRLYVDRILATGDTSRLHHPLVRQALQQALGYYPRLAQGIAAALTSLEMQDTL